MDTFRSAIAFICLFSAFTFTADKVNASTDIQGLAKRHGIDDSNVMAGIDATFNTPDAFAGQRSLLLLFAEKPQQMSEHGVILTLLFDKQRHVFLHSKKRSSVEPGYNLSCVVEVLGRVSFPTPYPVPEVKEIECLSTPWEANKTASLAKADTKKDVLVKTYSCEKQRTFSNSLIVHYQGEVVNQSSNSLTHLVAIMTFRTQSGEFLSSDEADFFSPILPGQSATFTGNAIKVNPLATTCQIKFRLFLNSKASVTHDTSAKTISIK